MQHRLLIFLVTLSTALAAEVSQCPDYGYDPNSESDGPVPHVTQQEISAQVDCIYKACGNCAGTCTTITEPYEQYIYCTGICDDVCSSCQNKTCTQCVSGYGLFEGSCFECGQNCAECTVYNGTQGLPVSNCTQCSAGYPSFQGNCISCGDNCDACTVSSDGNPICTQCSSQYALFQGTCYSCGDNCDECTAVDVNTTQCTQCASGYGVSEGACDSCASNCNACTFEIADSNPQCTQCSSNYGVYEGSCYHCLQDCTYSCNITPDSDDEYSTTCILAPPPSTTGTHSPSSSVRNSVAYLAMGIIGFYLAL